MIATLFANATEAWPLRAGVVHVWRFACDQEVGRLASVVSDDELAAANRFASRTLRDRYVAQRVLVRYLVARYLDRDPRALRFERSARGKPHIDGLELNLSHADDVALLAVARDVAVGIDVERHDADVDARALGRLVLAPDEAACTDPRAFLRIWCRKEACLKATGVGLVDDLTSVSVIADRVDVCGTIVHVQDLAVSAAHAAALATSAACAPVAAEAIESYEPLNR